VDCHIVLDDFFLHLILERKGIVWSLIHEKSRLRL
jgi:hypothetical protein